MTKRLISLFLTLVLLAVIPVSAAYRYNPYTNKLDYYEAAGDITLGDIGDITLTGLATGNILYYSGTAWVNLATGANTNVLTLAAGIPSWAAPGAPAAHAASHLAAGADSVDHDLLLNYLAAQHLTLPAAIAAVLTDHNKAAHDALLIDADTVDGEHAAAIVTNARVKAHFPDTIANVLSDHNLLAHTALGLFDQSSDVDHDATTNYLAAQHLTLPSTIAAVLTDHNLLAHTALGLFDQSVDVDHDATTNYVANQHINWTAAASNFSTSEDFFLTWTDSADHAEITQSNNVGIENQPLIYIEDERAGATVDEAIEATLRINADGPAYGLYIQDGAFRNAQLSELAGDVEFTEDIDVNWGDAADRMQIIQGNAAGIEAQALIYVQDDRTGATANEADEASLHITNESPNEWALYADIGKVQWDGNVLWSWASDVDNARITQTAVAGIADQPLILIDDDRTGATANTFDEATLEIQASGTYAMYINGSYGIYMGGTAGLRTNYGVSLWSNAYIGYGRAAVNVWQVYYDDNGAGDNIWVMRQQNEGANDTAAMFYSQENPSGMTDHDSYLSPTFVLANDEGADANDYAGVVIGERAQASVLVPHYFDFYAMTGALDGAVDPNAAEIGATFRFGDTGTTVPTYATGPGDVIFEDDVEIIGTSHGLGDATKYEDVFWTWADAADHALISQSNEDGIEDQALVRITDAREGAYVDEPGEASLRIEGEGYGLSVIAESYFEGAFGLNGDFTLEKDIFVTWDNAGDHAVITQLAVAGTEDVPLIFIDDDRTGVTTDEPGEATIVMDVEGAYSIYMADGKIYLSASSGMVSDRGTITLNTDTYFAMGTGNKWLLDFDANGAGDAIWAWTAAPGGDTSAIFLSALNPSGMTDHDDYDSPTLVLTNDEGADANDYSGVVIGERAQANVKVAHYFDFYAMTGASDGSVASADELPAIFRFGANGTGVPGYSTAGGDVLMEGALEIDGNQQNAGYRRQDYVYWIDCFDHGSTVAKYGQDWDLTALNTQGNGTNDIDTNPSDITLTTDNNAIGDNEGTRTDLTIIDRSRLNRSEIGCTLGQTVNTQFYWGWNTSGTNAMVAAADEYVIVFFDVSDNANWQIKVGDGATEDVFTSAVAGAASYIRHEIWVESDGTVHWRVNGTELDITGSVDNLMTASDHYLIVGQAQSVTGAAVIVVEIDHIENEKTKVH